MNKKGLKDFLCHSMDYSISGIDVLAMIFALAFAPFYFLAWVLYAVRNCLYDVRDCLYDETRNKIPEKGMRRMLTESATALRRYLSEKGVSSNFFSSLEKTDKQYVMVGVLLCVILLIANVAVRIL